jgi:ribosomal protein S27AE
MAEGPNPNDIVQCPKCRSIDILKEKKSISIRFSCQSCGYYEFHPLEGLSLERKAGH